MPELIQYVFVFTIAATIGSFLNVCIYRLPLGKSIVFPSSGCPNCNTPIKSYDNIPVLSYVFLRGKCRGCGVKISPEYPFVEVLSALFGVGLFAKFGFTPEFFIFSAFTAALLVITFIDLKHRIIPNSISLPGIVLGFIASLVISYPELYYSSITSLIGIVLGGGILFLIAVIYYFITGKEGMGGGDIKLLAMIGAFIGWKGVFFTLFISSFIGATIGGALIYKFGKDSKYALPFGPFLAVGALIYLFAGNFIIDWYFSVVWGL